MCSGSWPDEPKLGGDPRWCKSRESRGRSRGIGVEMSVLHSCATGRPQKQELRATHGSRTRAGSRRRELAARQEQICTSSCAAAYRQIGTRAERPRSLPKCPRPAVEPGGNERLSGKSLARWPLRGDLPAAPAQRPRRGLAVLLQKPCLLAVPVALRRCFAFVGELLAASKTDLQLRDAAMIEVEDQRDDGHALALRRVPELR